MLPRTENWVILPRIRPRQIPWNCCSRMLSLNPKPWPFGQVSTPRFGTSPPAFVSELIGDQMHSEHVLSKLVPACKVLVDVASEPVYSQKSKLSCKYFSEADNRASLVLWERNHHLPVPSSIYNAWYGASTVQMRTARMRSRSCLAVTSVLVSLARTVFCNRRNQDSEKVSI